MAESNINTILHGVLTIAASPAAASIAGSCIGWPESINATPFVSVALDSATNLNEGGGTTYIPWQIRVRYYFSFQTASAAEDLLTLRLPSILTALTACPNLAGSVMHCHPLRLEADPPLVNVGGVPYRRVDVIMGVKEKVIK